MKPDNSAKGAPAFTISQVTTSPKDVSDSRDMMLTYAASLNIDLAFQEIDEELSSWPEKYAAPKGCLLLARDNSTGAALGMIAVRALPSSKANSDAGQESTKYCEMKRLYVTPSGRGTGIGKALVRAIVHEARALNYSVIRMDTLPTMPAAMALYKHMGFRECVAYHDSPIENMMFFELDLEGEGEGRGEIGMS